MLQIKSSDRQIQQQVNMIPSQLCNGHFVRRVVVTTIRKTTFVCVANSIPTATATFNSNWSEKFMPDPTPQNFSQYYYYLLQIIYSTLTTSSVIKERAQFLVVTFDLESLLCFRSRPFEFKVTGFWQEKAVSRRFALPLDIALF